MHSTNELITNQARNCSTTTTSAAWYIMVKGYYNTPSTLGYQPVILLRLAVT